MATNGQAEFGESTQRLAKYIVGTSFDDLPEPVIEREKWHILDTIGCILYGTTTPWVQKVCSAMNSMDERGDTSVLGTSQQIIPASETLVNGTASHSMDYDDYCQDAGVHAGSATIPSSLAYVEASDKKISGQELLTAIALGVETSVRSGIGIGIESLLSGWHIAGWTGAFGAAASAGKLSELSTDQQKHALAVAGTQGAGLMGAAYGADVKRFHMGKAAESGYLAAAFAAEDFTGDGRIFEERWGAITTTMSDNYDIDAITNEIGEEYRLLDNLSFKPFPSVGQVHPSVNAIERIVSENDLDTTAIEEVDVTLTEAGKEKAGWEFEPIGVMSAQGSIQYAITAFLLRGDLTIDDYTEEAIQRSEILDRKENVHIHGDDSIVEDSSSYNTRYRTRVVAATADGSEYEVTVETPRGFPDNPMSEEERLEKFHSQAQHVIGEGNAEAIADFVLNIESQDNVMELFENF